MKKLALLALLLVPALALASGSRQKGSFTLSERLPGQPSADHFVVDYVNPDDPSAKPPAVSRVGTFLPRGARFDPSVPGSCEATDAELMAQGAAACPPSSAIGGGVVTVDTGLAGPGRFVTAGVEFFNNATDPAGEFIYLNTVRGSGARTVIRADVFRKRLITRAGMLPGTPPDGGAIDTVDVTIAEVSSAEDAYITTPPRCPGSGKWLLRTTFTYRDRVKQTVRSTSPCADPR